MSLAVSGPGFSYQPFGVQGGPMPPSSFNIPGVSGFHPIAANPVFHPGLLTPSGTDPPFYWTGYPIPPVSTEYTQVLKGKEKFP
ncbi:hypothetical protein GYMLUDRAFT_248534 [Collybiopsis luxurians FD-317 M1]|uniref:Uncharacterized protein n=1 Tax=Collybiopsis luxurians FD-317 M1 TaxID=944289 RepID=A0A0D0BZV2_9AGAR|nr:hypothetical protein GYMLUDRAFT_248534 [Collybiopsis luxurians FD-317 M1]